MKNLAYSLTLFALCAAGPVTAAHGWDWGDGDTYLVAQKNRISAGEAAQIVQRRTGARVLDAQPARDGYRVKVLTRQGEVRVYFVDAQTGAVQ